jgi:hypothetical protein
MILQFGIKRPVILQLLYTIDRNRSSEDEKPRPKVRWVDFRSRDKVSDREDPFAAVIRCTTDPTKADKRTRSKPISRRICAH